MSARRPDTHRDATLRELLGSPLDDRPRRGGRRTALVAAGLAVVVAAAVALPVVLLTGDNGDTSAGAATSSTTTAPTAPGTPGYPSARSLAPAVSAGPGRLVMVGGVEGDSRVLVGSWISETWVYLPPSNQWFLADPTGNPEPRFGQAMAYDEQSDVVVMFGGATGQGRFCSVVRRCASEEKADTWWFFPGTGVWTQAPGSEGPSARFGATAAYDSQSDRIVVFGGARVVENQVAELYADTWVYDFDTDTWTEMAPETAPEPRAYATATFDPGLDRILLWGGSGVDAEIDGALWAYDFESDTWTEVAGADGAPPPLWDATLVYAEVIGRSVLIGGEGPIERQIAEGITATEIDLNDVVWGFEGSTARWSPRDPLPGPAEGHAGVAGHAAAYDPLTGRIVVVAWGTTALYDPLADEWEDATPEAGD
jgi:hypothetical protein